MYSHLSKKEKLKQLAQARKRVLLWSVPEQTKASLKKSASQRPSKSTPTVSQRTKRETFPSSTTNRFYTPVSLSDNNINTIQALQQTLQDLEEQREAINITIDVLQHQLQFLLTNSDSKPKAR